MHNLYMVVVDKDYRHNEAKQKYRGMFGTQKSGNKACSGEIACLNIRILPKQDKTRCPEE